jgi:outer membrane receptor protein involved in Fe transport
MVWRTLLWALLLSASALGAQVGGIEGRVIDQETADPLPAVNVIVEGTSFGAASDLDGMYHIDRLPEGPYTITASMLSYSAISITDVEVREGEVTMLDFSLVPEAIQLETITVTAVAAKSTVSGLLSNQKKAATISSGISEEQISKSPDPKASDVVKRVTGVSVVDDKYVFVRGLSERYNNTRLNGSTLPSPEPDKRVVPFDIFPSNLLDNIVITKGFVPNLPGDFAGGCVQLSTKEFTERLTASVSVSFGYNSQTTFKDAMTYDGGSLDFLGIDDGARAMPGIVEEATRMGRVTAGNVFSAEDIERFGESFSNVWTPTSRKAPADQSYSISLGNQLSLFNRPLGFISSLTYKNSFSFREEESFYYIKGAEGLEVRRHYQDVEISNLNVLWGGVLNLSYKLSPAHKLGIKTTYTRTADDEVQTYWMFPNRDRQQDELSTRLRWVERSLLSSEISGEHQIGLFNSRLNWRGTYSLAMRTEPDTRETLYKSDEGENDYSWAWEESNGASRFFSHLLDNNVDLGLDWKIPFNPFSSIPGKLEIGGNYVFKDREINSNRFRYLLMSFSSVDLSLPPEQLFTEENIGTDGIYIEDRTRETDNYEGEHQVMAGYTMIDASLSRTLRFVGGARVEQSDQTVTTFDPFNPTADPVVGEVSTMDILPAANLTYKLRENMNLRAGFSQTVSRPSFRELSPFEFTDIGGHAMFGNPDLERTLIQNYDLRWEWYSGFGENLSIALMYKNFTKPIEQTIMITSRELTHTWQNAKSAYNYGLEFEMRQNLRKITSLLGNFTLQGNLALIQSKVELGENAGETDTERPLQGQSPYVVNVMLEYNHPGLGTTVSGMYNVFGRRIAEVGASGIPDIYEEPFHRLDFVITQPLNGRLNLKLSGKNLLDREVEFTQGGNVQRHYRKGRSFSLKVAYSL